MSNPNQGQPKMSRRNYGMDNLRRQKKVERNAENTAVLELWRDLKVKQSAPSRTESAGKRRSQQKKIPESIYEGAS